ncbi:4'-phosphopantetheinyl transferase superfamily protein [Myceligenerans sp. I2]|uniref:4'-phosphopantetheinyl transferase superfamily protein n=1 Tax=Myceligenerans indicum TaxID=2593663 RepID=A0ABS1LQS4_9MICO|nr:4'-phosphopantetheinyl transferase superfamily protein [Myceligenerans indicum]
MLGPGGRGAPGASGTLGTPGASGGPDVPGEPGIGRPDGVTARDLPDVLDDTERARLARFRRPADRERYLVAHTALRLVLGERLGRPPRTLRFGRAACPGCGEPHGRPVLAGGGAEPLEFSLSHGGRLAAVAVSRAAVGVDVEPQVTSAAVEEMSAVLHPAERLLLEQEAPPRRTAAFTRIWTRKEAYLKGLGIGLGRALDADDVTASPPGWLLADTRLDSHHVALAAALPAPPGRRGDAPGAYGTRCGVPADRATS